MRTRQKAKFQQYRQKHAKQWRCAGILLGIGFAYYLLIQFTPFHLFCLFQRITKLACPGCGITHFLVRLLHFDIPGAVQENVAVAGLVLLWGPLLFIRVIWHPKWLQKNGRFERILAYICVVLLLAFGILRNLPGMEFLLPSSMR
ncbi:DUF2752 domain-containing protein [uncultured Ruminococcus sp.]|uniref:DUF2752 domain-containing protein n=1 Tax=uncultured Ruminococcus sp. TaxID=165186 RepID=UPI0025E65647|nr:DUF2752 domain-containing protein [uncultured Ruminococcus sp.]